MHLSKEQGTGENLKADLNRLQRIYIFCLQHSRKENIPTSGLVVGSFKIVRFHYDPTELSAPLITIAFSTSLRSLLPSCLFCTSPASEASLPTKCDPLIMSCCLLRIQNDWLVYGRYEPLIVRRWQYVRFTVAVVPLETWQR